MRVAAHTFKTTHTWTFKKINFCWLKIEAQASSDNDTFGTFAVATDAHTVIKHTDNLWKLQQFDDVIDNAVYFKIDIAIHESHVTSSP